MKSFQTKINHQEKIFTKVNPKQRIDTLGRSKMIPHWRLKVQEEKENIFIRKSSFIKTRRQKKRTDKQAGIV